MYSNLIQGEAAEFDKDPELLVGTGLAYFPDSMAVARIEEPIVLLNLARWLSTSKRFRTSTIIRRRLRDPSVSIFTHALPQALAFYLWRRYSSSGLRLEDIATFPGTVPRWAKEPARFSYSSLVGSSRTFETAERLDALLVRTGHNSDEVFEWLERSDCPFLLPDADMGPQLVFLLDTLDGHRLVFVHLEPYTVDRPRRYDEVRPQNPYLFYAKVSQRDAQR